MPHESVDVFGAYYIDEQNRYARKGKPPLGLDDASLKELCSHGEIRLLHGRGSDTFRAMLKKSPLLLQPG